MEAFKSRIKLPYVDGSMSGWDLFYETGTVSTMRLLIWLLQV